MVRNEESESPVLPTPITAQPNPQLILFKAVVHFAAFVSRTASSAAPVCLQTNEKCPSSHNFSSLCDLLLYFLPGMIGGAW